MNRTQVGLIKGMAIEHNFLVSEAALIYNGLSRLQQDLIMIRTPYAHQDDMRLGSLSLKYIPGFDTEHFLQQVPETTLMVPTEERAVVDYLRDRHHQFEEYLLQAFYDYNARHGGDLSRLYEVAAYYDVPREEIDEMVRESFSLYEE